jgi:hypothetical protein
LLAAAMLTGTENVAPWQLLSEALTILTLPLSVTCEELFAGTAMLRPVWSV